MHASCRTRSFQICFFQSCQHTVLTGCFLWWSGIKDCAMCCRQEASEPKLSVLESSGCHWLRSASRNFFLQRRPICSKLSWLFNWNNVVRDTFVFYFHLATSINDIKQVMLSQRCSWLGIYRTIYHYTFRKSKRFGLQSHKVDAYSWIQAFKLPSFCISLPSSVLLRKIKSAPKTMNKNVSSQSWSPEVTVAS